MFRVAIKPYPWQVVIDADFKKGNNIPKYGHDEREIKPKFKVGETIFVKESFSIDGISYQGQWYWADGNPEFGDWTKPKPAQHMKQEHSRLFLRIKSVKVERLQDISEEDCLKEGVVGFRNESGTWERGEPWRNKPDNFLRKYIFKELWNSTHKKPEEKWEADPFCFVYEYEVIKK